MKKLNTLFAAGAAVLVACGGGQKPSSGLGGGKEVPPPPATVAAAPTGANGAPAPAREISKDAKQDYAAAGAFFAQNDKSGWNEQACRQAAEKFSGVVRAHSDLIDAQVMVGLSYHRCNLLEDAEKAYQQATRMKGDPTKAGLALSNLGEIYYRAGKIDGARQYWESAIKANGKLQAARIGLASLQLEQMRKIPAGAKDAGWKKLEEDAKFNLSSVLGVNTDSVEAYTVYGLIYMEDWQHNKNRLDLAKTLLDEAKKRNEKYAPLQNAYGQYYMHKAALNLALQAFSAAVEADPKFAEARMNVGQLTLSFRKYDTAKEMFSKVIELQPKNYDAYVGLGVALRGLKDFDGAEAAFNKAIQVDSKQGDAFYNLGVLYKDFRATKQEVKPSLDTYAKAKNYFQQFQDKSGDAADKAEAKEQIALIDKTTTSLQKFIQAQANQPPPPPAAPAAPPAGAPAAPPAGAPPAAPPAKK